MGTPSSILYLTTSGQVGGAERCLLSLIAGLDAEQFAARVLIGSDGPLAAMLEAQGVPATLVPLPGGLRRLSRYHQNGLGARCTPLWEAPGYLARLYRAGARPRPAIIHSNGLKMHYLSAVLCHRWKAPLIWHLHDFPARAWGKPEPWANRLLHRLSGRPDIAIANSEAVAQAYRQRFPRLVPKLCVVPNGVNIELMQRGRAGGAELRRRWSLRAEDFVIGMAAIFAPWKGQEIFLRAARQVLEAAPEVRFLLIGDDIYDTTGHGGRRAELEAMARDLGIAAAVRFTGFVRDEIAAAYAALDVMVHASTEPEPFGRTVIEAMAAGIPVIAAAGGGMLEIVQDGETGRLTRPGDTAGLAAAMLQLHADAPLRRRFAEAGLRRVRERFSEQAVGHAMAGIYAELREGGRQ